MLLHKTQILPRFSTYSKTKILIRADEIPAQTIMNKKKKVTITVCFVDHTWEDRDFEIGLGMWASKDRDYVEDFLRSQIEVAYIDRPVYGYFLSYWGPEEEET